MPENNGWTFDTLKEYLDMRFTDSEKAVEKANIANDKRFESVNEFRATLSDQQKDFLTRNEYSRAHNDLLNQVISLNSRMDKKEGESTGINDVWGWIVGAIGLLIAIAGIIVAILKK